MRRVLSCPNMLQSGPPPTTATMRQSVVAHSMPDLAAAAMFVPQQRFLECVMQTSPFSAGADVSTIPTLPFSQWGVNVPVSASAPDLAVCLATPDAMSSLEDDEEEEEGDDDEIARGLARTLAEERAAANRRRQRQWQRRLLVAQLGGGRLVPRRRR